MAIRATIRPQKPRKIAELASIFSFFDNVMVGLLLDDYTQSEIFRKGENCYWYTFLDGSIWE